MPALPPESDLFDVLRTNWQQDNPAPAVDLDRLRQAARNEVSQQNRRHLRSVLFMSASFVFAISVTSWVYLKFDDHGPLFYGSIIAVNLLMLLMGTLMWMGVQHDKSSAALNSREHIVRQLKKLRYRKFALQYAMPAYLVILLTALMCYLADVLAEASTVFKISAYSITIGYCFFSWLLSRRKTKRKINDASQLIRELEQLKLALEQPE